MLKNILIALIIASIMIGCGTDDSSKFTTIGSAEDCSGGALCFNPDATEKPSSFCTGQVNLTDQSNGQVYQAQLSGYPLLSFPTPSSMAEKKLFGVTIDAPCSDIEMQKITFDVDGLPSSTKFSKLEMDVDGKKVGKFIGYVSGDVFISGTDAHMIVWTSDFIISKSTDSSGSFTLEYLNYEAFPEKTSITVCLISIEWRIMLYDGHESAEYVMETPGVCQTTQF